MLLGREPGDDGDPMKERAARDVWPRLSQPEVTHQEMPLVLYVEDNPENQQIMLLRLRNRYRVVVAGNDRDACDLLRAHIGEIACVLMDIELQGSILNGIELAALMKGQRIEESVPDYAQDLPVTGAPLLFVTAYSGKYEAKRLKASGGVGVVYKPVDFSELIEVLVRCTASDR